MGDMNSPTRTSEAKKENKNPGSRTPKTKFSQSMNSLVAHILHLQRNIGNQAVQRLIKSGTL